MTSPDTAGAAGATIEIDEIRHRIPHRYPFLLVDRAQDYVPSASILGIKCVTANEPFFEGHFPKYPVMPGVLLLEAIAQTGALLISKSIDADIEKHTILFMSIDNARFRRPVRPGDRVEMPVEVMFSRRNIFKLRGRALVEGDVAAECEFAAMKAGLLA